MEYNVNYTSESRRDLDAIQDYIASEFQNTSAADRILTDIMDAVDQLEQFPALGPPLSSIVNIRSDYRFLVAGKYLAFYRILGTEIRIERVMYGRRDYLPHLFGGLIDETNT